MNSQLLTNQSNLSKATPTGNYPNCSNYTENQPGDSKACKYSQILTPLGPKPTLTIYIPHLLLHRTLMITHSLSPDSALQATVANFPQVLLSSLCVRFSGSFLLPPCSNCRCPPKLRPQPLFLLLDSYPLGALPTIPVTEGPSPFLIPTQTPGLAILIP